MAKSSVDRLEFLEEHLDKLWQGPEAARSGLAGLELCLLECIRLELKVTREEREKVKARWREVASARGEEGGEE